MQVFRLIVASILFLSLAQGVLGQPSPTKQMPPAKLTGTVLLPDGQPAANAPVVLGYIELYAQVKTDKQGKFELPVNGDKMVTTLGNQNWRRASLASYVKGFGIGFVVLQDVDPYQPMTIQLVDDVPILGRILDQQGRPVEGATLKFTKLGDADGNLDGFLKANRDAPTRLWYYQQQSMRVLFGPALALIGGAYELEVLTDAQGRFEIAGLGRERAVRAILTHPQLASQYIYIATRKKLDARWKRGTATRETRGRIQSAMPIVYSAEFRHLASPGMSIRGTLTAADNGEPIKKVHVSASVRGGSSGQAHSDVNGRFELTGLNYGGSELVISTHNYRSGHPWLDATQTIRLSGDSKPGVINLKLDRGVTVSGRAVDEMGQPVAGHAAYLGWPGNPELKKLSNKFRGVKAVRTAEDGKFSIVVPPGSGVLCFQAYDSTRYAPASIEDFGFPREAKRQQFLSVNVGLVFPQQYSVVKRIDIAADESEIKVDLTVSSGRPVRGRLVAGDDTPVTQFLFAQGHNAYAKEMRKGDTFEVRGLKPDERRLVYFRTADEKWAAVRAFQRPAEGKTKDITVRLSACGTITGRLADTKGQPLSGWVLTLTSEGTTDAGRPGGDLNGLKSSFRIVFNTKPVTTDADGYFRFKGVPANVTMKLLAAPDSVDGSDRPRLARSVRIRPKQNVDLGIVKMSGFEAN